MTLDDGRVVHGNRAGTVGLPLPGTAVKAVDPATGADLPAGTEGMIVVSGPQVMVGYLNRPEATAAVLKDGWYTTGDLGVVDADGFLKITDRLSRFSKIGGEMVPHLAVESAIMEATGANEQAVAVTVAARPQARRAALRALHRPGAARRRGLPPAHGRDAPPALDPLVRRISSPSRRSRSWAPARSTSAGSASWPRSGSARRAEPIGRAAVRPRRLSRSHRVSSGSRPRVQ